MYSKNDYRYYLEHRLAQSDDFLAHYGVKGMKWKKRKNGLTQEIKNIKYDLNQRQIGESFKGNTVYDPVKRQYKTGNRVKKIHTNESVGTAGYRNALTGEYKIKRRTTKSKLFKKISGKNAETNREKEVKAIGERTQKRAQYKRTKNGLENKITGKGRYTTKSKPDADGWRTISDVEYNTKKDGSRKSVSSEKKNNTKKKRK